MFGRVEVAFHPKFSDPGADLLLRKIELARPELRRKIRWSRLLNVYWMDIVASREEMISSVTEIFWDRALNWTFTGGLIPSVAGKHGTMADLLDASPNRPGSFWALERRFRPGVTDSVGRTTLEAFETVLGRDLASSRAASGAMFLLESPELTEEDIDAISRNIFYNDLIESCTIYQGKELIDSGRFNADQVKRQFPIVSLKTAAVEHIDLRSLSESELVEASKKNLWALSLEELLAIREHFKNRNPTDVEMEILAQTWSEHCKHKIFNAEVSYEDHSEGALVNADIPSKIGSLFKETIAGTTAQIGRPWLLSVFKDNAGIVALNDDLAFCIKVETHNSPSALDPYGGALTGIVGVNRDILGCGFGAKPIFNTNVFCLADPYFNLSLPQGIMHPRRILDGVRRGVEHGGNKSGIPTINGALVFDNRYLGKPLVYCGTGGVMPRKVAGKNCEDKKIEAGDRVVMVGGAIGKDGIHGATFSSLALDEVSPVSAVQLGDPITQKRAADFLLEARDKGLYRTLTDNGAGGLSSSVGEMAELSGGATIDVAKASTKYPGLKPFELVVSESQERMTIAVPPENMTPFSILADRRGVDISDLGEFNHSGFFEVLYKNDSVAKLDLTFLHTGNPQLKIKAVWSGSFTMPGTIDMDFSKEGEKVLIALLGRPNISSKEWLIRQYDHEVQGTSVIKPLHTVKPGTEEESSGPNDGGVLKLNADSWLGVSVGCGINPKYSDVDPYLMGQAVVDEAVRNILCVGAEFGNLESVMVLVDNFCWPDPLEDKEKAGALVRTCFGMKDAAIQLQLPFVSGKDSMKNDYKGKSLEGEPVSISVPPTLLITAVSRLQDIRTAWSSDFKNAGDQIYLLGNRNFGLLGSELQSIYVDRLREKGGSEKQVVLPSNSGKLRVPKPDWDLANRVYSWLGRSKGELQIHVKSAHDVSEGGLLTALSEGLMARSLGALIHVPADLDSWEFCFGEGFHGVVVSAREVDAKSLELEWNDLDVPFFKIGSVTYDPNLVVRSEKTSASWSVAVAKLRKAWEVSGYWE